MLSYFDFLRDLTPLSIVIRLFLAMICGGLIGLEREAKRRPAGFRTHILICLGAATTTLTSQYLYLDMHYFTDIGRLGAQVIAGIGFIGAGAIIVNKRRQVKGLTTAAGLWACAIVGLSCGAGFYEGAVYTTVLILIAEIFFSKLKYRMFKNSSEIALYLEYTIDLSLNDVICRIRTYDIKVRDLDITMNPTENGRSGCTILTLYISNRDKFENMMQDIGGMAGVLTIETL